MYSRRKLASRKGLLRLTALLLATALCSSCSTMPKVDNGNSDNGVVIKDNDPWESYNRKMFAFNQKVDKSVLIPAARGYKRVVPGPVRTGISNFFLNLEEPVTIVNDLLQGKFVQASKDTTRFLINSTLGLAGIVDIASDLNLDKHDEDFGQTFAVWGIGSGPYVELPFLGTSNVRDSIGLLGEIVYFDPIDNQVSSKTEYALIALEVIDLRSQYLGSEKVFNQQLDPYLYVRDAYTQRRRNQIYDGNPPLDDTFFDEDELFDDDEPEQ